MSGLLLSLESGEPLGIHALSLTCHYLIHLILDFQVIY